MLLYHKSFGSGKAGFCANPRFISAAERGIYEEAKRDLDNDGWLFAAEFDFWLTTLTDAESEEYWVLEEQHQNNPESKELERKRTAFVNSHGVHKCYGCNHWSDPFDGYCPVLEKFVRGRSVACNNFDSSEEDDYLEDATSELSDEELKERGKRAIDLMTLRDAQELARDIADTKAHAMLKSTAGIIGMARYQKLYDKHPEVFTKTICKDFESFVRMIEG